MDEKNIYFRAKNLGEAIQGDYIISAKDQNASFYTIGVDSTVHIPSADKLTFFEIGGYIELFATNGTIKVVTDADDYNFITPKGDILTLKDQTAKLTRIDSGTWFLDIYSQGGGADYILPTASATVKGGIKVGKNLTINPDGTLDASASGEQGPKGDKGDTGDVGPAGPQGAKGDQGIKGDTGDQGLQGPKGDKGDTGPAGPQGIKGDQGIQGLKGDKGDTGQQGAKGDQGIQGLKGLTGDIGPAGPQGIQGPKGDKGEAGSGGSIQVLDDGVLVSGNVSKINFIGDISATLVGDTVVIKIGPYETPTAPTFFCTDADHNNLVTLQINNDGKIPAGQTLDYYNYKVGEVINKVTMTDTIHFKAQMNKPNTLYKMQLQTVLKSGIKSDWGKEASIITMPDGPQLLTAVSNSAQSVDITFKPNANDGAEPYTKFYYSVYNSQIGTGMVEFTTKSVTAGVYSATIINIDPKACTADAKFQIAIANKVGQGTTSNSMTIEIKAPVMPTPENLKILNIDNKRNCLLDFKTITTDLDEVDYYNVKYNSITQKYISKVKDATTSEIALSLPSYNEQYSMQIQAVSKSGYLSNWSEIVKGIVPPGPPNVISANGGLASLKIIIKPNELDKKIDYQNWNVRLEGSFGTVYKQISRVTYESDNSLSCELLNIEDKYCVNSVTPFISVLNNGGESLYSICPIVNITKDNDKPKIVSFSTPNKKMVQLTVTGVKADQAIVVSFDRLKTDGTSYNEQFSRTLPPDSPYNYYYGDFVYSGDYNISFQPDNIPKWSDPVKITIK